MKTKFLVSAVASLLLASISNGAVGEDEKIQKCEATRYLYNSANVEFTQKRLVFIEKTDSYQSITMGDKIKFILNAHEGGAHEMSFSRTNAFGNNWLGSVGAKGALVQYVYFDSGTNISGQKSPTSVNCEYIVGTPDPISTNRKFDCSLNVSNQPDDGTARPHKTSFQYEPFKQDGVATVQDFKAFLTADNHSNLFLSIENIKKGQRIAHTFIIGNTENFHLLVQTAPASFTVGATGDLKPIVPLVSLECFGKGSPL